MKLADVQPSKLGDRIALARPPPSSLARRLSPVLAERAPVRAVCAIL